MRLTRLISFCYGILFLASSCKKDNIPPAPAAIVLVNAIPDAPGVIANFSDGSVNWFGTAQSTGYGAYSMYTIPDGEVPASLYFNTDTTHTIFSKPIQINIKSGLMYSLYLTGTSTNPDTLFTNDVIPAHSSLDSSVGVRFINLSPDSDPFSVNIQGNPSGSELASLPYRTASAFKNYPANSEINSYTFEICDAGTGEVLTTCSLNALSRLYRFRNVTVVIGGLAKDPNGSTLGTFLVKHF